MPTLLQRLAFTACVGTCLLSIAIAHAADAPADDPSPRLELRPARYAEEIHPGDSRTLPVKAHNRTGETVVVTFRSIDLQAGAGDAFATAATGPVARSARGWLDFPSGPVTLQPGDEHTIDVRVSVPADARPGAYAVAVVASQEFRARAVNDAQSVGTRVKVHANVGSTFVIVVSGAATAEAKIRDVSAPRLVWGGDHPVFRASVENTGDTLLKLEAATELSSFGAFASRSLRSDEHPTLPGGRRRLEMQWSDRPWIGWFQPKLVVVGGSGSGVRVERALPTVFVLPPWWVFVLVAAAIALPIWSGRRRRRRLRTWQAARHAERAQRRDAADDFE